MRISVVALAVSLMSSALQAAPVETFVEAPGPQGPLKGTMLSPANADAPVVLIIPGSGPTDRDGNNPLGIKAASYRLLAEGLAEAGVASVRIDKRGMFASAAAIPDPNDVTIEAYADDVHAWIDKIRKTTGKSCVWVLGHSEGGLVALEAAQRPEGLCGLVLVAAPGRRMGEIIREQLMPHPAGNEASNDLERAIATLEAGKRIDVSTLHPLIRKVFPDIIQGFLISELTLDPAALAAAYSGPLEIVQGDKDLQIKVVDAERLKAANAAAKLVILAGVNHVLKAVSSDKVMDNIATYADPSLPLAPGVVQAIADFVTERR